MDTNQIAAFVTALTSLLVALTALIKVLQTLSVATSTHETVRANTETIKRIDSATNGALTEQQGLVKVLRDMQATPAEIAARLSTHPPEPVPPRPYIPGVSVDRRAPSSTAKEPS